MTSEHVNELDKEHIEALSPVERLRLVELIVNELATTLRDVPKPRSLMDLEGLGEEIWRGIGPQIYVNELRDEWDKRP
jgi:hypothetical protein